MGLSLCFHPLSSFCHKVLIALYENETPFAGQIVESRDAAQPAAFAALWRRERFRSCDGRRIVPETTIIIEYFDEHSGANLLLPEEPDAASKPVCGTGYLTCT